MVIFLKSAALTLIKHKSHNRKNTEYVIIFLVGKVKEREWEGEGEGERERERERTLKQIKQKLEKILGEHHIQLLKDVNKVVIEN